MSDARQMALLDEVAAAIEALLLGGTTTASEATQRTLAAAFEEASRARFLRLGSTLRIVIEELKRLDSAPERFSGSRLAFFLDRAWLLASATRKALTDQDAGALQRITALPANEPVAALAVAASADIRLPTLLAPLSRHRSPRAAWRWGASRLLPLRRRGSAETPRPSARGPAPACDRGRQPASDPP